MTKPSVRKKPTNKEIASTIIEINNKVNDISRGLSQAYQLLRQMDIIIGMYVDMNGDTKEFSKFIELKRKEAEKKDDAETDGKPDSEDIPEDTKDEGSGSERVREKAK